MRQMAQNGDVNIRFGVYRSVCCGLEIVIGEGVTFPDCPRHIKLSTEWKLMVEPQERMINLTELSKQRKGSNPAA
jgi:hypothetical protein